MVWGGPEEQKTEHAPGILDAKNWPDEALKLVEDTIQTYWNDEQCTQLSDNATVVRQKQSNTDTLAFKYDWHYHAFIKKARCKRVFTLQ